MTTLTLDTMDDLLEKAKKAVEKFNSKQSGDKNKATKVVLSAVLSCKKYIEENEREDRGIAQRCARDLSEILSSMPLFKSFAFDKKSLSNIHTKSMADEHLDMIQKELERVIKEVEIAKRKKVRDWVRTHPIFGKLRRSASKRLPEGAYVLLFRRSAAPHPKTKKDGAKKDEKGQNRKIETLTTELLSASSVTVTESITKTCLSIKESNVSMSKIDLSVAELNVSVARTESSETKVSIEETIVQSSESVALASRSVAMESSSNVELSTVERRAVMQSVVITSESQPSINELRFANSSELGSSAEQSSTTEQAELRKTEAEQTESNSEGTTTENSEESRQASHLEPQAESTSPPSGLVESAEAKTGESVDSEEIGPAPELVLRPSTDGRIFTRFRPREFADETRVYRMFRGGPPIVGACVIAQGKLSSAYGTLPQPKAGGDQLRLLLSISKEAVGRPGKAFVESHEVLGELFSMCKSRKVHKEAYILLFELAAEESSDSPSSDTSEQEQAADSPDAESGLTGQGEESEQQLEQAEKAEISDDIDEELKALLAEEAAAEAAAASTASGLADAEAAKSEIAADREGASSEKPQAENADGIDSPELDAADSETPDSDDSDLENIDAATLAMESPLDDLDVDEDNDSPASSEEQAPSWDFSGKLELVSKKAEDGRIITRYRSFDFIDSRTLFEGFRNRRPIVGAAVIRERELIRVIGVVPKAEGESQIDTLLNHSRQALEKPSLEFIASNEVLNSLHQQSINEFKQKDCSVVLFTETEGRPTLLSMPNKKGYSQSKIPISDFRSPRFVHDRFKTEKPVIGASIIGETGPSQSAAKDFAPKGNTGRDGKGSKSDRDRDRGDRDKGRDGRDNFRSRAPRNLVVLAAFGRTPLKQNVLLSPEILKRLGVDLSIL